MLSVAHGAFPVVRDKIYGYIYIYLCLRQQTNLIIKKKKNALSPLITVALHSTASLSCMQTRRPNFPYICKQRRHCPPEASEQVAAGPAIGQESPPQQHPQTLSVDSEETALPPDKALMGEIECDG